MNPQENFLISFWHFDSTAQWVFWDLLTLCYLQWDSEYLSDVFTMNVSMLKKNTFWLSSHFLQKHILRANWVYLKVGVVGDRIVPKPQKLFSIQDLHCFMLLWHSVIACIHSSGPNNPFLQSYYGQHYWHDYSSYKREFFPLILSQWSLVFILPSNYDTSKSQKEIRNCFEVLWGPSLCKFPGLVLFFMCLFSSFFCLPERSCVAFQSSTWVGKHLLFTIKGPLYIQCTHTHTRAFRQASIHWQNLCHCVSCLPYSICFFVRARCRGN